MHLVAVNDVGNQLPILLISFEIDAEFVIQSWESVTNPLDKLSPFQTAKKLLLGISYQSS